MRDSRLGSEQLLSSYRNTEDVRQSTDSQALSIVRRAPSLKRRLSRIGESFQPLGSKEVSFEQKLAKIGEMRRVSRIESYVRTDTSAPHARDEDDDMLKNQLKQTFDKRLKYKLKVRQDARAERNYKIHSRFLSPVKYFVIFLYIGLMPFISTPYYCLS